MNVLQHILAFATRALPAFAGGVRVLCGGMLTLLALSFITLSTAHAAVVINNTATLSYTGITANSMQASVDISASGASFDSATVIAAFTPDIVNAGSSTTSNITITNTGINPLSGGTLTITPPAGTTMTITGVAGQYTVSPPLPNGDIVITILNPLPPGASLNIPGNVAVPPTTPTGTLTMGTTYIANGIPVIVGVTPLNVQNIRTPSTIEFLQQDVTLNLVPASVYHAGSPIFIQVTDGDQNIDPYTAQTVTTTLTDSITGDTETLVLTETGINTGIFIGNIPSSSTAPVPNTGILTVAQGSDLTATYTDIVDNTDIAASAALVDPFGIVFDSSNGNPVDGIQVTLINTTTGLPAAVFGDDGVSTFPASITSGGTATDSSGAVYNFPVGEYRFPFVNPGTYQLRVTPTASFAHPSTVATAQLQLLPGAPWAIVNGSRNEFFVVNPGPALNIDIPIDPKATGLFVQKIASKTTAAAGDFVQYRVSIENTSTVADVTAAILQDTLPQSFRYQAGSAKLDNVTIADPIISANGRGLSFNIGTVLATTTHTLTYITSVGANIATGDAINTAIATGTQLAAPVASNQASATVKIIEDLISSKSFITGRVFVDAGKEGAGLLAAANTPTTDGQSVMVGAVRAAQQQDNGLSDAGEKGLAGVRIYLEDGTFVITDKNGLYHFKGVEPGRHVVQLDVDSLPKGYQAKSLGNNRFAGSDFSQFVDVLGGGIWRANFRVTRLAPPSDKVIVKQALSMQGEQLWVSIDVQPGKNIPLQSLTGIYQLPKGWSLIEDTAQLNGKTQEPEQTVLGLTWNLDASLPTNNIRFAVQGGGDSGDKQSIAYARFTSAGTKHGRTDVASIDIKDTVSRNSHAVSRTMHLNFKTRQATLPAHQLTELDTLITDLKGLQIKTLTVEGHTDNVQIALKNRKEFANNQVLSEARAAFIATYLSKALDLDEKQVIVVGKGGNEAIADNRSAAGRNQNRRVVILVDAEKASHQLATDMMQTSSQATGKVSGSWLSHEKEILTLPKTTVASDGITSPVDHASLQYPTGSVRIILDSKLTPVLSMDDIEVSKDNIGFVSKNPKTGKTIYTYIGVDFAKQGEHSLQLKGMDPFGNARFDQTIHIMRTGEIADIEKIEAAENKADGITPIRVRLQLKDNTGSVIQGSTTLEWRGGDLTTQQAQKSDPSQLTKAVVGNELSQVAISADGWITLAPTNKSGVHHVLLGYNDIQRDIEIVVKPAYRDWIMVGFGEGTLGYNKLNGAIQPIKNRSQKDSYYSDGRLAFYAKGKVKGDFLVSIAYDTAKTQGKVGNKINQTVDPNSLYTVYGDASQQQYDASSQRKLYVKIEKGTFYALFGDFETGLSTTELSRYSRQLNGLKSEYRGELFGYTAFATQTSKTLHKDELRGDGTSGLYHLNRTNITANSEKIFIETRDRFRSEVIIESRQLTRFLDYSLDYSNGSIYFKQPVASKDAALNPIYIRAEYESDDQRDELTTFGGRASITPIDGLEIGATYIQQGQLAQDDQLGGIDAKLKLGESTEILAEIAQSRTQLARRSNGYKAELRHNSKRLSGTAYIRQVDDSLGLGQINGSENATRKFGGTGEIRLTDKTSLQLEAFRQQALLTGAQRDSGSLQASHNFENGSVRVGARTSHDTDGLGNKLISNQLTTGATAKLTDKLSTRIDREQSIGQNSSADFPTRTTVGVDYQLTMSTVLSATQEWTQGDTQNSQSTRFGVRTQPWTGAQLATNYEQRYGESGLSSFANVGLQQQWQATESFAVSAGIDRTQTLRHAGAIALNTSTPLASGGGDDFTAYSLGLNYTPAEWAFNNRLEYRTATTQRKWNITSGVIGSPMDDLSALVSLQISRNLLLAGTSQTTGNFALGAAYRPHYDGLTFLDRFDIRYSNQQDNVFNTVDWRYINNFAANWQAARNLQVSLNYGAKWMRENIDQQSYSSFTDLLGLQATYDINELWDISFQGSMLHAWKIRQYTPSLGMAVGYNIMNNAWLGLGYNFVGFYDTDFSASSFTRQGPYVRFRFKFDQKNLAGMLNATQ